MQGSGFVFNDCVEKREREEQGAQADCEKEEKRDAWRVFSNYILHHTALFFAIERTIYSFMGLPLTCLIVSAQNTLTGYTFYLSISKSL